VKIDAHYYTTAALCRAAGFSEADSLQIAHADQYTDNATASHPLDIPGDHDLKFDPVRTAHIGLEAFDWRVQKTVYVPFHFLPPTSAKKAADPWLVRSNGNWAWGLLLDALGSRERNRLMRIGIALHTFQDQWSHEGFSGRQSDENNAVNLETQTPPDPDWHRAWSFSFTDLAPSIGHAEIGTIPDEAHRVWRVTFKNGRTMTRSNPETFLDCHHTTYMLLKRHTKGFHTSWRDIQGPLKHLLRHESVPGDYQRAFGPLFPNLGLWTYSPTRWAQHAFLAKDESEFYGSLHYLWHRAALDQRFHVLRNLL